ncbi:hypothetical protein [Microlunatus parietis]
MTRRLDERRRRQYDRALTALCWRRGKLRPLDEVWFTPTTVTAAELDGHDTLCADRIAGADCDCAFHQQPEVDHGPSSEVTKRQDQDHHPKSDPSFFEGASLADTSAVRSSLSPAEGQR